MLSDFLTSWPLFAQTWIAGWCAAPLLGLLGVAVLARQQIFLGVAMSQAATAGVAGTVLLFGVGSWLGGVSAVCAAVATACVIGRGGGYREGRTAWVFLALSAAAPLLVAHTPHGSEEVLHLLASSLIGATWLDCAILGGLLMTLSSAVWRWGRELRVLLLDPGFAQVSGLRVSRWQLAIDVFLGLSVGWSLHVAGFLFTVGCLALPALMARHLARELWSLTWIAALGALFAAVTGSVLAHAVDLPPGQVIVAILALMALAARVFAAVRGRHLC